MSREKYANHLRNAVAFVRWAGELANDAKIDAGDRETLDRAQALLTGLASKATTRVARTRAAYLPRPQP